MNECFIRFLIVSFGGALNIINTVSGFLEGFQALLGGSLAFHSLVTHLPTSIHVACNNIILGLVVFECCVVEVNSSCKGVALGFKAVD